MIVFANKEDIQQLVGCRIVAVEHQNGSSVVLFVENNEEQRQPITFSAHGSIVFGGGGIRPGATLTVGAGQPA